jgi:hypothetical protein
VAESGIGAEGVASSFFTVEVVSAAGVAASSFFDSLLLQLIAMAQTSAAESIFFINKIFTK